jgi:inosine-uridine nucleoside N-ribohydrolase
LQKNNAEKKVVVNIFGDNQQQEQSSSAKSILPNIEQSEIPPLSGAEQPQTINNKPETENMEVHQYKTDRIFWRSGFTNCV